MNVLRWYGNSIIQNTSTNAYKQFSYNVIYLESESILVGRSACKAQQELWIALDLRSSSTSNHFEYLLPQPKQTFKFGIPYFKVFYNLSWSADEFFIFQYFCFLSKILFCQHFHSDEVSAKTRQQFCIKFHGCLLQCYKQNWKP